MCLINITPRDDLYRVQWLIYIQLFSGNAPSISNTSMDGALVCVKENYNFKRAKINFVPKVCLWGIEKVEVQYLETGVKTVLGKTSIYRLADQFKEVPPLAQLVVLAGYKPPDKVENWSTDCYNHIQKV